MISGTVMALAAGMPLDSGWPDIAVELVDAIDEDDCSEWCGWLSGTDGACRMCHDHLR